MSRNKWQWKHNSKPMGWSKNSPKREVYSNTILPQETRTASIRQPKSIPKAIGKRRKKKPQISRRKEIIKIWAEINEKEMKETIVKINKTKGWFFEKINKIDKPLARLSRRKERTKSTKLEGEVRTDNAEIQRTIRDYYEQLWKLRSWHPVPSLHGK